MKSVFSPLSWLLLGLSLLAWPCAFATAGSDSYAKTVTALQARHADEMVAHQRYGAYANHAEAEGYPAIAHLFRALAASEAVHARNFARLLRKLDTEPAVAPLDIEISSTREHLKQAATVEAAEIDKEYPAILDQIRDEGHKDAILFITYAWKAEQQHRELILKIKKGASWFFGTLVSRIEGSPARYHVCQVCGSTVTDLPDRECPICDHPPEEYREVT